MVLTGFESDSSAPQDLGRLVVGGTITGEVHISGTMGQFMAGRLALGHLEDRWAVLTPDPSEWPEIFTVGGDLHSLWTNTGIGIPGVQLNLSLFKMRVDGRVGYIFSPNEVPGEIRVNDLEAITARSFLDNLYFELEHRTGPLLNASGTYSTIEDTMWLRSSEGYVTNHPALFNDTFATAQFVAAIRDGVAGPNSVRIRGELAGDAPPGDTIDYYAIPLLAGQTISAQLIDIGGTGLLRLGVFDPDGRLIGSDYSNVDDNAVRNQAFGFTADRPGIYIFAVAGDGDTNFDGAGGIVPVDQMGHYEVRVSGVEDLALGGISATQGELLPGDLTANVIVSRGDLGTLRAANSIDSEITVWRGDLRVIYAELVSGSDTPVLSTLLNVAQGNVGLIRTFTPVPALAVVETVAPIGGDIQVIDIDGVDASALLRLDVNGGIGIIRTSGSLGTPEDGGGRLRVGRTGVGNGVIELIDVGGHYWGPLIHTGQGGDVRFIRVDGFIFNHPGFGGGFAERIYGLGESITITDDSGAVITLAPAENIPNPQYNPAIAGSAQPEFLPGFLTVASVGIASGGSVIVRVGVGGDGRPAPGQEGVVEPLHTLPTGEEVAIASGLQVSVQSSTGAGRADIGQIIFDLREIPDGFAPTEDDEQWVVSLGIGGNVPVGVFDIVGSEFVVFEGIHNTTEGGQIINAVIEGVGSLYSAGTLGLARGRTGAALLGRGIATDAVPEYLDMRLAGDDIYPMVLERNGIIVRRIDATPTVVNTIRAKQGLGHILVMGSINRLVADADSNFSPDDDIFEGIAGPVWASDLYDVEELNEQTNLFQDVAGRIESVYIGEGIAPAGSGLVSFAGLYAGDHRQTDESLEAQGYIGPITGGYGANIMGHVVSTTFIAGVTLNGGSIINAEILSVIVLQDAREGDSYRGGWEWFFDLGTPDSPTRPSSMEVGPIRVNGSGGIIGTLVGGVDIHSISVPNGFGILNSLVVNSQSGYLGPVTAGGYGLREVAFVGASHIVSLNATGNGTVLPIDALPRMVIPSQFDAPLAFSHAPSRLSDVGMMLGPTPNLLTGVMDEIFVTSAQHIGTITAYRILDSVFNASSRIDGIQTRDLIDGLSVTTGSLGYFRPGSDVSALYLTFAGSLSSFVVKGNVDGNSVIRAVGPNADIRNFQVTGNFHGDLIVAGVVRTINIGGDLTGNITIDGSDVRAAYALNQLLLGGSLTSGSLDIVGNVNLIRSYGSFGSAGDVLTINGNLNRLQVGTNGAPAELATDVVIWGNFNSLTVNGVLTGDVRVEGDLRTINVTNKPRLYRGMAVDTAGRVLAIDTTGQFDTIVEIDPATGAATVVGTVADLSGNRYRGQVLQLAFDNAGKLYALVSDVNGLGAGAAGAALVQIEATDGNGDGLLLATNPTHTGFAGVPLDGGGVTANFTALAVDFVGRLWAVRRDGAVDTLVRLDIAGIGAGATVTQTVVGAVARGGSNTNIVGMGFSSTAPLETLVGTASDGSPLVFNAAGGQTVTVNVLGPGNVEFYDEGGAGTDSDNVIDTLRLDGTDSTTVITITTSAPGSVNIGRVLAAAGSIAGSFSFDGLLLENLVAVSINGRSAELLAIDINAPSASTVLTAGGVIDGNVDAFAVGRSGAFFDTYAYDTNNVLGGVFYANAAASLDPAVRIGSMTDLLAGDVTVLGNLGSATLSGGNVTGDFSVLGASGALRLTNGNMGGNLIAGQRLTSFMLTGGDVLAGAEIASSLSDVMTVQINNGDLLGAVRAANGRIGSLNVLGSDMGPASVVEARSVGSMRIDNAIMTGAVIQVTDDLATLTVGSDVEAGVMLTAGSAGRWTIGGDLAADVTIGYKSGVLMLTVGGDLGSGGGVIEIAADVSLRVAGDVIAGTTLSLARNVTNLQVSGMFAGHLLVARAATTLTFGSIVNAVLTFGFDVGRLSTSGGGITGSLIQAGVDRADGSVFAGGDARRGKIGTLTTQTVIDSIISAGGDVTGFSATAMTGSTLSAGLALAGAAIDSIISGVLDLTVAVDRDTARSGGTLYRGDIGSFSGGVMTASQAAAGVDPGDGDFMTAGDNTVVTSLSGGASIVRTATGTLDAASAVIADAGIGDHTTGPGAANNSPNVTYALVDITANNPLAGPIVGTATQGSPLVYVTTGGHTVTITLTGAGSVSVYDEANGGDSDDVIDALVLTGTTTASRLTIKTTTPGAVGIGRVLALDDATVSQFVFDGDIVGDGTDDVDIWFDGPVATLTMRDLGDGVTGKVGGDVTTLGIEGQGAGGIYVGGTVRTLRITSSASSGILGVITGAAAGLADVTEIAIDSGGLTWVFDGATQQLARVDLTAAPNAAIAQGPFNVVDLFGGAAVNVQAMDFTAADLLLAVAQVRDPSPTAQVGAISAAAVSLRGMAVNSAGQIYAIDSSSGFDRLVRLNPSTGVMTDVGILRDTFTNAFSGQVLAIAFDAGDNLLAIVEDRDGVGGAFAAGDGAALARIETSDSNSNGFLDVTSPTQAGMPPILLNDGGAVTDAITAMAVDSGGTIWAVIRVIAQDLLVTIDSAGAVTLVGAIQADGADTNLVGFGFDDTGELIGFDNVSGSMVHVDTADPTQSQSIGTVGAVSPTLDAFVIRGVGASMVSYAYDTDDVVGGLFFKSSPDGVAVLGSIDTTGGAGTGAFTRILALAQNAAGMPLTSAVRSIAVDTAGAGHIFAVTADGNLYEYDADGVLVGGGAVGTITDASTGQALSITQIDFNAAGELVGVDATFGRLVTIDTATAQATRRVDNGTVPAGDLAAYGYDPVADEFLAVRAATDNYVRFLATTKAEFEATAGGLTADSFTSITINGSRAPGMVYNGRITATGNTIGTVTLYGDFGGQITSDSSIRSFQQSFGDYEGAVRAGWDLGTFTVIPGLGAAGDFKVGGVVESGDKLNSVTLRGAQFDGLIQAGEAGTITIYGASGSNADIRVARETSSVRSMDDYAGSMTLGWLRSSLMIQGALGAASSILIGGDASTVSLSGGTAAGSVVSIGGATRSLTIGETHAGQVASRGDISRASLATVAGGLVIAGGNLTTVMASGAVTGALMAAGTWVGADGIYNTADDVIFGGSINSATFRGAFTGSALVAGVLPSLASGPGIPGNVRAYTGNAGGGIGDKDSATAGGILPSSIGRANFSASTTGSAVAAADQLGMVSGKFAPNLATRAYGRDPLGPPQLVGFNLISGSVIELIFNEPIDTASVALSIDLNNDGLFTAPGDVLGSITLTDSAGTIIDTGVQFDYLTQVDDDGRTQGVLRIVRAGGFNAADVVGPFLTITLHGNPADPAITDRSGLRSVLRDFNQATAGSLVPVVTDPFGTVFDGDDDGLEGGDRDYVVTVTDAADDFLESLAQPAVPITVDAGAIDIRGVFESIEDVDIYRFSASAFQFLSLQVFGSTTLQFGIFHQDDQGTTSLLDDTFELVTRHEVHVGADTPLSDIRGNMRNTDKYAQLFLHDQFQAVELPQDGNYYIVVEPLLADDTTYHLQLTLASTDDMLDGVVDGSAGLPEGERIAYVSNFIGQNNNLLGANTPKQLVYLNFDGGTTQQYDAETGNTLVEAFDPDAFGTGLSPYRDILIDGGTIGSVTFSGIVDKVMSIFSDTPASHPLGQLNVQRVDADLSSFFAAANGLWFTTVDPTLAGLDPLVDYSIIYIGETDPIWGAGLLGVANTVDLSNMDKALEAVVAAQGFAGMPFSPVTNTAINQVTNAIANTLAHELGHILGLNHQPTDFDFLTESWLLQRDDPANGLLAAQNGGSGVDNAVGLADFRITTRDGVDHDIDIDGAVTVQDVVDLINAATGDRLTAMIDSDNSRLVLTDHTGVTGTLTITALNGTTTAVDLGILGSTFGVVGFDATLNGQAILTTGDGNDGVGLMAYAPAENDVSGLTRLGTDDLSREEFPVGQIDTVDLLLNWLS